MVKSWKTSTLGLVSALSAICSAVSLWLSGHPDKIDLPVTIAAISSGLGLVFARDNDKTSEAVRATTPTPTR